MVESDIVAVIDVTKCTDCRCCTVSCKDEHAINDYLPYSAGMPFRGQKWIRVENIERGTFPKVKFSSMPIPCQHCDAAPCMAAATDGAVYKRPDGIVIIDPEKSKGQKQIVGSCPYGAIFWNEEKQIPQKCTFCAERLAKGEAPRCMLSCPGGAIKIGERSEILKAGDEWHTESLYPEYKTTPRVYYMGLPKTFITGVMVDSQGECLEGADITAKDTATGATLSTRSDFLGEFWFDGLQAKKTYEVTASKAGKTKTMTVSLNTNTDLGDIAL